MNSLRASSNAIRAVPSSRCAEPPENQWRGLGRVMLLALLALLGGCGSSSESPSNFPRLEELHGEPLDAVSTIPTLRLRGVSELELSAIGLVSGKLSRASLAEIVQNQVSESVAGRRVPLHVARDGEDFLVTPLAELDLDAEYTLFAVRSGELARFSTAPTNRLQILKRVGSGPLRSGERTYYCGSGTDPISDSVAIKNSSLEIEVAEGTLGKRCLGVLIATQGSHTTLQPPILKGPVRFEPAPLFVEKGEARRCTSGELELNWKEVGGRVAAHLPSGFANVELLDEETGAILSIFDGFVGETSPVTIGPVPSRRRVRINTELIVERCRESNRAKLTTAEAAPFFELSEVLADPLGPEPASEWVEVRNVGNASGSLEGYVLEDSSGSTPLPKVQLNPGEYGLIVGADFSVDPKQDPIPEAATLRVTVASVGTRGLTNSGEKLSLRDGLGKIVSTIPALPASPGKSWSRVGPSDERESFVLGEPSPGR